MKKILVSGCFDLIHAGHIAFLKEAATHGEVHVCVGADDNIRRLKGHEPMFSEEERVYVLNTLGCVTEARVSAGRGILDFAPDIDELKPDLFVVNEDGHTAGKQELCESKGVEYRVLDRLPAHDFPPRSSSGTKARLCLPYRVCIAGGWMDQPWVNEIFPGSVITAQLEPTHEFIDRAGLATSTRRTAERIWGRRFPSGDALEVARILFAVENEPGSKYISGAQDAIGLVSPAITRMNFSSGRYWPDSVERIDDPEAIEWLQEVLHFVEVGPRPDNYDPLIEKTLTENGVKKLARSGDMCWEAIKQKDIKLLGEALNGTVQAWQEILPNTVPDHLRQLLADQSEVVGASFSGCGGGYLMVAAESPPEGAIPLRIKVGPNGE